MAQQKTERMDKAVRAEVLRILRERVNDPTKMWDSVNNTPNPEYHAGRLLKRAEYFDREGLITIAGMDYYRRETTNPILTWLRSNWFAVIVAGCTIGVSIVGIVSG